MSTGYQVDVDELSGTVAKLHAVAASLDCSQTSAAYDTSLAAGTLGAGFGGADVLQGTHTAMQEWIAEMISTIQSLIHTYGSQTKAANDAYRDHEQQTARDFYSAA
ncbi:hypothetical protein [Streptacidiphilus sp. EB129]|uniref:hypothetical protein n=1 Tax=Streptacidiphilus sp. EB129 TaxID=3156262 RepID=UPI003511781E